MLSDHARGVLERTREILGLHGWGKYFFRNPTTGCMCVTGALRAAGGQQHDEAYRALLRAAEATTGRSYWWLSVWNDEPSRTMWDVVSLIDRVLAP